MSSSYQLHTATEKPVSFLRGLTRTLGAMFGYLQEDKKKVGLVFLFLVISVLANILTPYFVARGIDVYIAKRDLAGLATMLVGVAVLYAVSSLAGYLQLQLMGRISQMVLFRLRNHVFDQIQSLPMAFFHQNKAGDLISRINNDTDKVNQFLSEFLIRFVSTFITLIGIGVFVFTLHVRLAVVLMATTIFVVVVTQALSGWVQRTNKESLTAEGRLSGEVQEGLENFKVLVAFHRQDYFMDLLGSVNEESRVKLVRAQIASGLFNPLYAAAGNLAQIAVLVYGVSLIHHEGLAVGLLIGFLVYTQKFYEPLRIIGVMWGNFQSTLAAWSRIEEILKLRSSLTILK